MPGFYTQLFDFMPSLLTPTQRYQAMRSMQSPMPGFLTNKWFILLGWSLISILLVLLLIVRRVRVEKERQMMEKRFCDLCDQYRLTVQEREILEAIYMRSKLKKKDLIFTEPGFYDEGLSILMQESFEAGHNIGQRKRLNIMAYGIKTKLCFQKSPSVFSANSRTGRTISSRQIQTGHKVLVSLVSAVNPMTFEAGIIRNEEYELAMLPEMPIEAVPGQVVEIQYKMGAVTWEFNSMVISCGPQGLEINHTENIRFVNRRRFPRVPIQKKAMIAKFEIFQDVPILHQPEFTEAIVTEISGPGLRIRADLEVNVKDRVLVVFEVESGKLVQDIAEVRGFRDTPLGRSIGVEMVGLTENAVDELIRITNQLVIVNGRIDETADEMICDPEETETQLHEQKHKQEQTV